MADILYFTAAWCGPCKMFKPTVQEASAETGAYIQYIDVDQNPIAVQKYGISSVPTMLIVKDGVVTHKHNGVLPKQQLKSFIANANS